MNRYSLNERILGDNEKAAVRLRARHRDTCTLALNLIASPGAGKTSLLEATVPLLAGRIRMGALVGDIATERDADRLRRLGIPARQILTGGACHLDARQVEGTLRQGGFDALDILFIENVGNLVCPTSYDLGEDLKVALLSVTEGDDKPFKYPAIFSKAEIVLITKIDLLPHVTFDIKAVRDQIESLNRPGRLLVTSARTGEGIAAWADLLQRRLTAKIASPRLVS